MCANRNDMLTPPGDIFATFRGQLSPTAAVTECIDNECDAGATRVIVCARPGLIAIASDATGWTAKTDEDIKRAFTPLRAKEHAKSAVGHFNFGLKAAAMFLRAKLDVYAAARAKGHSVKISADFPAVLEQNAYTDANFAIDRKTACNFDALAENDETYALRGLFRAFLAQGEPRYTCLTVFRMDGRGPFDETRAPQFSLDGPPANPLSQLARACGLRYYARAPRIELSFMVGDTVHPVGFYRHNLTLVAREELTRAQRENRLRKGAIRFYELERDPDNKPVYAVELVGGGLPAEVYRCSPYALKGRRRGMHKATRQDLRRLESCSLVHEWRAYELWLGGAPFRDGPVQRYLERHGLDRVGECGGTSFFVNGVRLGERIRSKNDAGRAAYVTKIFGGKEFLIDDSQAVKKITELQPFVQKILERHRARHYASRAAGFASWETQARHPAYCDTPLDDVKEDVHEHEPDAPEHVSKAPRADMSWGEVAALLKTALAAAGEKPGDAVARGSARTCKALHKLLTA